MGSIRLTAVAVEKLIPPQTGRKEIYDADVPGLVLRLSSSGAKGWSFTYRVDGLPRRLTLGSYPGVSLKLARERARDVRAAVQRGEDPVQDAEA
ncbi:MAG: Arm DNA-binding domain-containing protein [bacterium]|nr:Arm DNA-binding domain-containing protein [bacterium]